MFTVYIINKRFCMFRSFEQNKKAISITFTKDWFKFFGTVIKPFDFIMT